MASIISVSATMAVFMLILLAFQSASAAIDETEALARIYERPLAGLMAPSESAVNCTVDTVEENQFWSHLLGDPVLQNSFLEEYARQNMPNATGLGQHNSSLNASSDLIVRSGRDGEASFTELGLGCVPYPGCMARVIAHAAWSLSGPGYYYHGHWHHHHGHWHRHWHGYWRRLRGTQDATEAPTETGAGCASSRLPEECCNAEGYGEMSPGAVENMASMLNLSASHPTNRFIDLGSGVGRVVLHMAIKGYAKSAIGVELNRGRHGLAVQLAKSALPKSILLTEGSVPHQNISQSGVALLQGDMLDIDLSGASIVYMNPPCLPCTVQNTMIQKILDSSAEYVVSTLPLDDLIKDGKFMEERAQTLQPMIGYSWELEVLLYRRSAV